LLFRGLSARADVSLATFSMRFASPADAVVVVSARTAAMPTIAFLMTVPLLLDADQVPHAGRLSMCRAGEGAV
jgi:hypothetical protein